MARETSIIGRPKGGGRSAEESRAHILDAAERVFAKQGVNGSTVADIAREARVSRPLLYRHFASRDAIVIGVLERASTRLVESLLSVASESSSMDEFIVDVMVELLTRVRDDPVLNTVFDLNDRSDVIGLIGADEDFVGYASMLSAAMVDAVPFDVGPLLRPGLTIDEASRHMLVIGLMLVNGPSFLVDHREELARYIHNFVLPAVVANPPPIR